MTVAAPRKRPPVAGAHDGVLASTCEVGHHQARQIAHQHRHAVPSLRANAQHAVQARTPHEHLPAARQRPAVPLTGRHRRELHHAVQPLLRHTPVRWDGPRVAGRLGWQVHQGWELGVAAHHTRRRPGCGCLRHLTVPKAGQQSMEGALGLLCGRRHAGCVLW